ncbi:hypothetical protein Tel_01490 [Candidatus Tenderia electrophaga]|jgi:hypothetical protein|uniref:Inner membrane protein YgaP-like transmembrane domain-containing protein n=1 Tax=Candidatus Tenderia electrophaga TaxID=1748243 RepID=A0A0S2T9T8_9GAMM|nr:hypothetical protein Tel_01490 [Candidatus Tenderia electrophaga]
MAKIRAVLNTGPADRITRLVLGFALFFWMYSLGTLEPLEIAGMFVSFYLLLTGLLGWDPIYHVLKFKSMSEEQAQKGQPYCENKPRHDSNVTSTRPDGHSALRR